MTTTINLNLDIPQTYNVGLLKRQLMEYAQRLVVTSKPVRHIEVMAATRKIKIS